MPARRVPRKPLLGPFRQKADSPCFAHVRKPEINVANVAKRENYPLADLAEARRIARELVKLHRDGAIKSERDASFYANPGPRLRSHLRQGARSRDQGARSGNMEARSKGGFNVWRIGKNGEKTLTQPT